MNNTLKSWDFSAPVVKPKTIAGIPVREMEMPEGIEFVLMSPGAYDPITGEVDESRFVVVKKEKTIGEEG